MNANRIGLGPPTRDDYLVQEMMALMREAARERGARYEIPWLNVVVERRLVRDRVHTLSVGSGVCHVNGQRCEYSMYG